MSEPLLARVAAALPPRADPPSATTALLVAWSGGLDSTALLHLLIRLRAERPDLALHAVHVDHGMRPDSADDAAFCRDLGRAWGVDTGVVRLEIAPGASPQLQARAQRYAALEGVAAELRAGHIATAHHGDDALETALIHGARGSSAPAVASLLLPTVLPGSGVALVRPLISTRREELVDYARVHGLSWREDPTNAGTDYTRNRLRHEGLPELFPTEEDRDAALARLRALAPLAAGATAAAEALLEASRRRPPWIDARRFDRRRLRGADPHVVREALRLAVAELHGAHLPHVTAEALLEAIFDGRPGLRAFTGHGVVAQVERDAVDLLPSSGQGTRLLDARRAEPMRLPAAGYDTGPEGWLPWFEHRLVWRLATPGEVAGGGDRLILPRDDYRLAGPEEGARLVTGDDGRSRPVRELLARHGVPASERWRWPCVYRGDELLWVCGVRGRAGADKHPAKKGELAVEFCPSPSL